MGKGGTILGMIALIIGIGGLGFGFIAWTDQGDTYVYHGSAEFWYDYKEDIYTPPDSVYINIPDLYLIFTLNSSATVHMLFTTSTRILPDPLSFADMIFYFWIDGVRLLAPFTRAGPFEGDATYQYYPVALQHSQILSAGTHNVSIVVFSETAGNFVRSSCLAITRY
ncbi:MAG: hypothetical protein ACW98X_24150 [Promethearchaeota archaeon]|jgi:hypothetical protein